ncbi:MAG: 1-deoxy-D-xylulose-5-phosphate reductoisomerase [Rhodospirillales bacterium]|nr:1-deoxy-D-xylulose-5-phosphate reductoisomerase [Rhodospirillales bacterium]
MKKCVSILGATGSIGQSTADVIDAMPERFEVCTVTAHTDARGLADVVMRLKARRAVIADASQEEALAAALKGYDVMIESGAEALEYAVQSDTDLTVAAISGIAGLRPLMHAIKNSKAVAIANKEPLVAAGDLVKSLALRHDTQILPIDSEHNAVFQVFNPVQRCGIRRIILTASGGPFRTWNEKQIAKATPAQAVEHPNWDMGAKISVDSASMMNKALEVIEAHVLFDMPPAQIDVLIHPQSVVHSMVEYVDGSVLAQMGASDMRTPIAYALGWPERIETPGQRLDLTALSRLEFEEPDLTRFPALRLAYECLGKGPMACLTLNAANEVAVAAFLQEKIAFPEILSTIEFALRQEPDINLDTIDSVEQADEAVRSVALTYIEEHCAGAMKKLKA